MSHKLSLIPEQNIANNGWNAYPNNPYDENKIQEIKDNISKIEVPVTSIPSPFAQMHLFETSFTFINKAFVDDSSVLRGKTSYHKYISQCLDVFEILFSYETLKLQDRIEIQLWKKEELTALIKDKNVGLKTFAETLKIFITNYNNDRRFVNQGITNAFDECVLIYIDNTIVAGTSPYTGFFITGDSVLVTISDKQNRKFFSTNKALYEREEDFQKYMNVLFTTEPEVAQSFKELQTYIKNNNTITASDDVRQLVGELERGNTTELVRDYKILEINNEEISFLSGRVPFLCEKFNSINEQQIAKNSDFVIKTSKRLERPPLALLEGVTKKRWTYLDNTFPENCIVRSTASIEDRKLPESVIEYPWITRDDVLSKHLIQLEYNVNIDKYWLPQGPVKNIILPVTPTYFNYFTIEDLKKQITVEKLNLGAILITLDIPVQGDNGRGTIKFERTYDFVAPETIDNPDYGAVVKSSLAFGIYPFFKVSDPVFNDRYKALSFHLKGEEIDYQFFREENTIPTIARVEANAHSRTRKDEGYPSISTYLDITNITYDTQGELTFDGDRDITFDGIIVTVKNLDENTTLDGCLLPLMGEPRQLIDGDTSIAFDIGTSNSFVALKTANQVENLSSYEGKGSSIQPHFVLLNERASEGEEYKKNDLNEVKPIYGVVQDAEFLPSMVGDDSLFKFPIRSVINVDNDTNAEDKNSINILSNANIPFAFGHSVLRNEYDFSHSNIKWGITDSENQGAYNKLRGFVEELAWIGRNKLLSEGYQPKVANVIWFKPLSMATKQTSTLNIIWEELYTNYYSKADNISKLVSVTESWAPYYSYDRPFGAGEVFMNLDIGGGTTDLIVFKNNKPALTTSYRFAGNSLFESYGSHNPFDNGFVSKYEDQMLKYFGDDVKKIKTIEYIKESKGLQSTDLVSYFFNYKIFIKNLKLDSEFKLLFLIHNCAIFYHSIQILKMSEVDKLPSYIGVSGNGAKLLEVTNIDKNLNKSHGMSKVVQFIIKEIFELEELHKIELQILNNPKESTAIGGIQGIEKIKQEPTLDTENYYISVGTKQDLIKETDKEAQKNLKYADFIEEDNTKIDEVTENIVSFFEYFFDTLWYQADFVKNFGVDKSYNTDKLKVFFTDTSKIKNTIREVINHKIEVEQERFINDTFFFEAIKAYLYAFSKIIVSDTINEFKGA
ncbi:cell division protein FtsA [uncultured Dokdonia sp.]|uniref:cell division protein FtsA n=1 Tax=uncultured Dokdonia sp. TaxID=575653 RepID=UPI00261AFB25|nr:cell division protein FtsA [uncultured Dokdonia sp.]